MNRFDLKYSTQQSNMDLVPADYMPFSYTCFYFLWQEIYEFSNKYQAKNINKNNEWKSLIKILEELDKIIKCQTYESNIPFEKSVPFSYN